MYRIALRIMDARDELSTRLGEISQRSNAGERASSKLLELAVAEATNFRYPLVEYLRRPVPQGWQRLSITCPISSSFCRWR